jgi:hypothetical protein
MSDGQKCEPHHAFEATNKKLANTISYVVQLQKTAAREYTEIAGFRRPFWSSQSCTSGDRSTGSCVPERCRSRAVCVAATSDPLDLEPRPKRNGRSPFEGRPYSSKMNLDAYIFF